jgi:hypothetical protein
MMLEHPYDTTLFTHDNTVMKVMRDGELQTNVNSETK